MPVTAGDLIVILPALAGVGGALTAGFSAPLANGFKSDRFGLKQRLFMMGSDQPTRWRRALGLTALTGFLGGAAAIAYAASPAGPSVAPAPAAKPAPTIIVQTPSFAAARITQTAGIAAMFAPAPAAASPVAASAASPAPTMAMPAPDLSRPLDAATIDYYYNRMVADNPSLKGARPGLTADEARRLTALEAIEADYWAGQPAWSRRSFASYDDAVGVLGKANVDDLTALQKKWRSGRIEGDLDQLSALSPQDRQVEIDRRAANLSAKLSQRSALSAGSPQYATLSRDIADAQANLADIQNRYGLTPR